MRVKLSEILSQVPALKVLPAGDPDISGVACDSRRVGEGSLFVAVKGEASDGHDFLKAAADAGAVACIVEDEDIDTYSMDKVVAENSEEALGWASCAFWDHPSRQLTLVGITGTNGKTTTAHLIQQILSDAGIAAGRIGTVGYSYPSGEDEDSPLTTPDAPTLQAVLAKMVEQGAQAVVAEISSHALMRKRTTGCAFACTVFTNLSQDHLDFHGSMEEYFEAKKLLFTDYPRLVEAVINVDDPWCRALAPELGGHVVTFGLGDEGDVRLEVKEYTSMGTKGLIHHPGGKAPFTLPLPGDFNAQNAAAALGVAWALGLDFEKAAASLAKAPQTPGRLEKIDTDQGFGLYVDYAHTPDALGRVLEALRPLAKNRLICVFGCGGDRDKTKRPLMGEAATRWSDIIVLTADNSRSEDTAAIINDIEEGIPEGWPGPLGITSSALVRLPDRREAIFWAVKEAKPGDIVLLAGKGHEDYQILGGKKEHFDDREEARNALAERGSG
ncbi:MAG: UDP-N-acetylmuramoyl-L-alanyl-D-glutamate--2,6-diaminopimelate ligase [Deltaproteobacteria bacterium]|nr:MAG: UDP-N-acetylmuramoyl-L-alanyl-D-glutamate--2,6-diaminopimelate ligase [Deltaproteobacteria bacterium]